MEMPYWSTVTATQQTPSQPQHQDMLLSHTLLYITNNGGNWDQALGHQSKHQLRSVAGTTQGALWEGNELEKKEQ